ncbi:MAG: site-specific integrase [Paludibacteraceae bacterium]|nr:site-specific integrase [Paludibacteraceae bacterium]
MIDIKTKAGLWYWSEQFMKRLNDRTTRNGERQLSESTKRGYLSALRCLKLFVRMECGDGDLTLERVDKGFFERYTLFLQNRKYKANTVAQYIGAVVAVVHWLDKEERDKCDTTKWHCGKSEVDSIYLTEAELGLLLATEFKDASLKETRDWFVAQAYMGCRYSDLEQLAMATASQLRTGYLEYRQQKTLRRVVIPLHPIVLHIINNNEWRMPKLPRLLIYNKRLKQMARIAGLNRPVAVTEIRGGKRISKVKRQWELVTSHTARRSFATNMFRLGIPTQTIMAVTGHRSERTFMRYIRLSEQEQAETMKMYWQKKA